MPKIDVAILGATGAVGQRFIQLLESHPWFRVHELIGKSSAGKTYREAVNWVLDGEPPASVMDMVIKPLDSQIESRLVFSALPKEAAIDREMNLASAGHIVCTNASAYRMTPDVPLLLADNNSEHIGLIDVQRKNRGWTDGALVANSNCTAMPIVMSLTPLLDFGVTKVQMVSQQAISGAGYPGVASLDIIDNVIPYVSGDEAKMETEILKMMGSFNGEAIDPLQAVTSATATRVPVIDGHLVSISVELAQRPPLDEIIKTWETYEVPPMVRRLPSTPAKSIQYLPQIDRPQPRRDRLAGSGMMTSIGRLRTCPILGYKYVAMSHNTIRGAAGSSIQNAELLVTQGYIPRIDLSDIS
jgi:aspartate-semialdehyde dehydrogenase